MKIAFNRQVKNKPNFEDSKVFLYLTYNFHNEELTQEEVAREINKGFAITTWHTGGANCCYKAPDTEALKKHRCENGYVGITQHRLQKNFLVGSYIGIDFDTPESVKTVFEDQFIKANHSIFYNTPSSTPEKPRFRVLFELEEPIPDAALYREAVGAFIWKCGAGVDDYCKDPCRIFYGSKGSNPVVTGHKVSPEVVKQVIEEWKTAKITTVETKITPAPAQTGQNLLVGIKASLKDIEDAGFAANGFVKKCRELNWQGYSEWQRLAALALGLDHAFGDKFFYETFANASRQHPEYNSNDETKLNQDFPLLDGKTQPFANLGLKFDPVKKQAFDPSQKKVGFLHTGASLNGNGNGNGHHGPVGGTEEMLAGNESEKVSKVLADFTADDDGNSLAFLSVYPESFKYCEVMGWLNWNGKFWDTNLAEFNLKEKVVEVLKLRRAAGVLSGKEAIVKCTVGSSARVANCIERIQSKVAVNIEGFDKDPNLINCANGVLNLKTGILEPPSPKSLFTYCLATEYDPRADYSDWVNFLTEVVEGGPEIIQYIKMALGYSLTGNTSEEALFYIYGPTRSGKGLFSEVIMEMLGKPLSTEADFNTFTVKRDPDSSNFDLAPLKPSRIIFASESNRFNQLNTARTKSLTGGNMVRCCFKHKDFFTYQPQFKLWMSSNWPVNGDVDDDAFWGRFRVINFPNSYLGREDKYLKQKMKKTKNLKGVLRWLVEGAMDWFNSRDGLVTPDLIKLNTKGQRDLADFVQMWLEECTEPDATYWVSNADITHSYQKWCEMNNVDPKSMRALSTALKTKDYIPGVINRIGITTSRGVQGFRII